MQRHIELYLSKPTASFCLLLDGADDILDFDEHDPLFWKKGLLFFDSEWKHIPTSQTILPRGVCIKFDFMYGINKDKEFVCHEKRQGILNITIVQ